MIALALSVLSSLGGFGEDELETEADFYEIVPLPAPDDVLVEVGGLALLPDGRPILSTRRGYVYVVDGAYGPPEEVTYTEYAQGLHEPLGLLVHDDGWIYTVQRGELSRMRDVDGDDRADEIECVSDAWHISGNYHEYNFGPRLGPDGRLWITTNKPFGDEPFGRVPWRGFALAFDLDGTMTPIACGLRSPAGIQDSPWGDVFYTDNQGEWCGASKLAHLEPGDFHGHPWGIFSCHEEEWTHGYPGDPPDGKLMPRVRDEIESFKLPAVWFPYDKMGRSPAGFVWDQSEGAFGPFAGQVLVGDQYASEVMRVSLEEVKGGWQGACYPFREGFASGIVRLAWGADGSLLVGMTNRGWGSVGSATEGLARLVWKGGTPFEVLEMRARFDGFTLAFTAPVDAATAADPASYRLESYTYELHEAYGSAELDRAEPAITAARVADDGLSVELVIDGLRAGYVHELHLPGVRSADGRALLHPEAYYTLVEIP